MKLFVFGLGCIRAAITNPCCDLLNYTVSSIPLVWRSQSVSQSVSQSQWMTEWVSEWVSERFSQSVSQLKKNQKNPPNWTFFTWWVSATSAPADARGGREGSAGSGYEQVRSLTSGRYSPLLARRESATRRWDMTLICIYSNRWDPWPQTGTHYCWHVGNLQHEGGKTWHQTASIRTGEIPNLRQVLTTADT